MGRAVCGGGGKGDQKKVGSLLLTIGSRFNLPGNFESSVVGLHWARQLQELFIGDEIIPSRVLAVDWANLQKCPIKPLLQVAARAMPLVLTVERQRECGASNNTHRSAHLLDCLPR